MNPRAVRRILLINPNTSPEVTRRLVDHLQPHLPAGTELLSCTAAFGAPYISCEASHAIAAHAVLRAWMQAPEADAVLIGCFGDPGLFALKDHAGVPVTGLAEASFIEAARKGPFAVVTGGSRWKPMLQRLAHALGVANELIHIETIAPTGADLMADPVLAQICLSQACEAARAKGANSIIIGGAGLAGWAGQLQSLVDVPLIDSVESGLRVLLDEQIPTIAPGARADLVQWLPVKGHLQHAGSGPATQ